MKSHRILTIEDELIFTLLFFFFSFSIHPAKQQLTSATGDTAAHCKLRQLFAGGKWSDRWMDSSATYE